MDNIKEKLASLADKDVEVTLDIGNGKIITLQGWLRALRTPLDVSYSLGTYNVFKDGKITNNGIGVSFDETNVSSIIPIEETEDAKILINEIREGNITVRWSMWSFSGGHTDGDYDEYLLYKDDMPYGRITVNMQHGISIWRNGQAFCTDVETEDFQEEVKLVLLKALKRDDKELAEKLMDSNGEIKLPGGFEDITREDVLNGTFNPFA